MLYAHIHEISTFLIFASGLLLILNMRVKDRKINIELITSR